MKARSASCASRCARTAAIVSSSSATVRCERAVFGAANERPLLAASCGGGEEAADEAAPEPAEDTEQGGGESSRDPRCTRVPPALVKVIATGLEVQGGGNLRFAQAVKSEDFESVYFVSADIQGPGLDGSGDVGTWATNRLAAGGGLIFAVDSVAQEFSDWGDADQTDANITMQDDGAQLSRECVEAVAQQ
jgi:hypothetical protein